MKTLKNVKRTLALGLVSASFVSAANASVTYMIGNGGLGTFNGQIDGTILNDALAGGIQITKTGGGDSSTPSSYVSICTDLEGTLYLGQSYTYNTPVTPFSGLTGVDPTWGALNSPTALNGNANNINSANATAAIQNAAYIFYTYGMLTSTGLGNSADKEAIQLAVWAALYDTGANGSVNDGTGARFNFSGVSAKVSGDVASYLTGLTGNYDYTGFLLTPNAALGNQGNGDNEPPQELLIGESQNLPAGSPIPVGVPEAPTIISGVVLMTPFAFTAIRILRRKHMA